MKLKKKKLNKDKSKFKQRCILSPKKYKLLFGNHGLFFKKSCRLELIYFVLLRKILKKLRHFVKDKTVYHKKIWFWLRKNYVISKKSKNARMGKGKGKFLRYAVQVPQNYMVLEFYGWHMSYLNIIKNKFSRKISMPLGIFTKELNRERTTVKNRNYGYHFIRKYNTN